MKGLGAHMARQPTSHLCSGMLKHSSELIHCEICFQVE